MGLFSGKKTTIIRPQTDDFAYLTPGTHYFDSACQTLRPTSVITAERDYYQTYNSCGHRVKYPWGEQVDRMVEECRGELLKLSGKSSREYAVAFGLNTTSGINSVLQQIDPRAHGYRRIVTSEIEHNSVFLPSLVFAKRHGIERAVLKRSLDRDSYGALVYEKKDIEQAIVIVNTMSNIDGQELKNLKELCRDVHATGGLLLLDACQTFAHHPELLHDVPADAIFGSGHKMYGPSIGFTIIKKKLITTLDCFLIGGSTVTSVERDQYTLIDNADELYARLEPGLQNYAGIAGLLAAIIWLANWRSAEGGQDRARYEQALAVYLNQRLRAVPGLTVMSPVASPIMSVYSDHTDSHKLAVYLGSAGIMCRSGYHCCHYYLQSVRRLPPLLRISLGLQTTTHDIDVLIEKLAILIR